MGDCLRSPDRGLRARAGEDAVFTSVPLRQTRSFRGRIRRGAGGWEYPLVRHWQRIYNFLVNKHLGTGGVAMRMLPILLLWLMLRHHAP
jgi:hypothetical protein